jgi:hypothetical protein
MMAAKAKIAPVALDDETRRRLRKQGGSATAEHRTVLRSRIVLCLEKLGSDRRAARQLRISSRTVRSCLRVEEPKRRKGDRPNRGGGGRIHERARRVVQVQEFHG